MRIPKFNRWDPVIARWVDSSGPPEGGWTKITKRDQEISGIVTVGQVFSQSDDRLTLVLSWDPVPKHADGFITIPTVAITSIRKLT